MRHTKQYQDENVCLRQTIENSLVKEIEKDEKHTLRLKYPMNANVQNNYKLTRSDLSLSGPENTFTSN